MGLQAHHWYMDILRSIIGITDSLIFSLIKWIMYGIFDLSSLSTNSEVFSGLYSRIYVILGIFMAFKLSFSFFQYLIDPDSMGGKSEKGVGKLFRNVFIMLFALIALPAILFGQNGQKGLLSRAQDAFLPVLPRLLFGTNSVGNTSTASGVTSTVEQSAEEIAVTTLDAFFSPPEELDDVCGAGTYQNTPRIKNVQDFTTNINLTCNAKGTGVLGIGATKYYKYSYLLFVSTIVGILIVLLLLGITIDIAKRIFKLIILEIIAPVPIMSLIDPKGAKDGAFSKWVHSLTTTFLDIFLKLGLVYLIIVLIHMIVSANDSGGIFLNFPSFQQNGIRATYLTVLLILGLIFFAKEAPKFIKESLGIKGSGSDDLFKDVKTLGQAAGLAGGAVLGTAGGLAGGIAASAKGFKEGNRGSGIGNALMAPGAAIAGAIRGGANGLKGAGKNGNVLGGLRGAISGQNTVNANKITNAAVGSTIFGRTAAGFSRFLTGETPADRDETRIAAYKNVVDSASNFKKVLADAAGKSKTGLNVKGLDGVERTGITLRNFKGTLAAANAGDAAAVTALASFGFATLAEANAGHEEYEKKIQTAYYDAVVNDQLIDDEKGGGDAVAVMSAKQVVDSDIRGLGLRDLDNNPLTEVNAGNSGKIIGAATTASNAIKSNSGYKRRKRNAEATKGKK